MITPAISLLYSGQEINRKLWSNGRIVQSGEHQKREAGVGRRMRSQVAWGCMELVWGQCWQLAQAAGTGEENQEKFP